MPGRSTSQWMVISCMTFFGLAIGTGPLCAQSIINDAPKSAKERLGDKASDEQRVNNCHVPLEKRGTKPRPDCPTPQEAGSAASEPSPKQ